MNESTAGSSASANMIHSSMVKLLIRRASAYVELHDMQHAQADLQEVIQTLEFQRLLLSSSKPGT